MTYTAKQLAQIAMQQVRFDLTIGESNTREGYFKTGGWSCTMVERLRRKRYFYQRVQNEQRVFWISMIDTMPAPVLDPSTPEGQYHINLIRLLHLTASLVYKAGNCEEMAYLACVRLSELAIKHLSPEQDFEIEFIALPCVDHVLVRIKVGNDVALCDPWIHYAGNTDPVSLSAYLSRLHETLNPIQQKIFEKHKKLILLSLAYGISDSDADDCFQTINGFAQAYQLVSMHQRFHEQYMYNWYAYEPIIAPGYKIPPRKNPKLHQQMLSEIKNEAHVKRCMTHWRKTRAAHEHCQALVEDIVNNLNDENASPIAQRKPCSH